MTDIRNALIQEVKVFSEKVKILDGVIRIAVIGSLTTTKPSPKDIDMLVTVTDEMNLSPLATLTRRMNGHVQALNHNAEVFLANSENNTSGESVIGNNVGPALECVVTH